MSTLFLVKNMQTLFTLPVAEYQSQIDPVNNYLKQVSFYISVMKQIPLETALQEAKQFLSSNFKNKEIKYFQREENQDRSVQVSGLIQYIQNTVKANNILAPTFTTYVSKLEKTSILSEFIANNVKRRSQSKRIAQKAKSEGNTELFISKNNEQNMMKIYNNSLSGAFAQGACVLHNPTSHSTLTTVTRSVSSITNASNESIISGNKYLPRPIDVLNHIVYISSKANIELISEAVETFKLHLPTVEETVEVLQYSSNLYFYNNKYYSEKIIPFLSKLTPYHRAAICYTSNLYHTRIYNEEFIRTLLEELIQKVIVNEVNDFYVTDIRNIDENVLNFVHQLFFYEVKGYGKDYGKMNAIGLTSNIYKTSLHVYDILNKYSLFFKAFLLTNIMPSNSHLLRFMRRRTVVLSDTDSTCFTLDKWVKWYLNDYVVNEKSIALTSAVAFITTQVIVHILAQLSKNLNISNEDLNILSMKNEYLWTVHIPAEVSKHYTALTVMQEGNVFSSPELEIKGVHLKNSAVPKVIIDDVKNLISSILLSVNNNEKISLFNVVKRIYELEESIALNIHKGNIEYFKKSKIKNKEAYAKEENLSPFQRHTFWMNVFSSTYGKIKEPPYDVIKIPTTLNTPTDLKNWIESIQNVEIKSNLINWLTVFKKTTLPTVYLETSLVAGIGIPKEILSVIDLKRITLDISKQHRIVLEALGVILNEDQLVSELFLKM